MSARAFGASDSPLDDFWDRLWLSMRWARVPGLPDFLSQFCVWIILPAVIFWSLHFVPLLLSRRYAWMQNKAKYFQIAFAIWGFSDFIPALIFLTRHSKGTFCDLYNQHITPQLMYTDAVAVLIMMALHMIIEQADMRQGIHATGTLLVSTLLPYPYFLYDLAKREQTGYRVTGAQRPTRYLYLLFGVLSLIIWIVPLVAFWNTYGTLDLRHSGAGVAPDRASALATTIVTAGYFMFATWAIPQIKHTIFSYLFVVVGIVHLGFAMGLFLFIRLSEPASRFFLVSGAHTPGMGLNIAEAMENRGLGSAVNRRSTTAGSPPTAGRNSSPSQRATPRRGAVRN